MQKPLFVLIAFALTVASAAGQAPRDNKLIESGWDALQQGNGDRAAAVFQEALSRSPRDPALHYGAAWAAHLLGRDRDAVDSLNRALALNARLMPAIELLGQIEYTQGNLKGAIERYEQALPFAAGRQTEIRQLLDRWRKEQVVHQDFSVRDGAQFSVVFDGQTDNFLAGHTVAVLERAFARIADKIGASPSKHILVTLYTQQQFRDVTDAPAWSGGRFDGKIRIPVQGASQNMDEFDRILVHELTHAMISGLAMHGVPAWLNEGLAGYFESRDAAVAQRRIESLGVFIPFSQLQEGFGRFNAATASVAYDQSLVAADLLVRLAGQRMAGLLQGLGNGQSFEQSMGQLGLQASDFEAQVVRRLKAR